MKIGISFEISSLDFHNAVESAIGGRTGYDFADLTSEIIISEVLTSTFGFSGPEETTQLEKLLSPDQKRYITECFTDAVRDYLREQIGLDSQS